ncbi:hypothetical protein FPV67DRAFT_424215 [Lyophyllum atratum]|nr:hypothetical protein FPV67DRAFT_424215 [Lyophyllum atratum]
MVADDDRPTRKSKSENRLYRFITRSLTRSRSRSRSRNGRDSPPPIDPDEPVPDLPPSQSGRIRIDSMGQSTPSKPATRIPSRPLSSTTTATNTTITPGTPRPKKRPPSAIPIPEAQKNTKLPDIPPRPVTPKASAARKKLHTLFGIPLSSPKKSSFNSSTHSSRRPSIEAAPPLPDHVRDVEDDDATPKALKSYSPHLYSRPESPSPEPRPKLSNNPSTSSTITSSGSGSSRLQRFFTGQKTPPPPSVEAVSGPMRRPSGSSHQRRNSASNSISNQSSSLPSADAPPLKPKASGAMGPPPIPAPRIGHTPATPLHTERPGTAPQVKASSSLGHASRKGSVDSGRGIGQPTVDGLGAMNGHTRLRMNNAHGHGHRSTKHGSFDFERPGWSAAAGAIQRTGSGGTTGTGTSETGTSLSGWGRAHDGLTGGMRESTMGPGFAGVGTLQRSLSLKRGKEREEATNRAREEERRRRKAEPQKSVIGKEKVAEKEMGILPPERSLRSQPSKRAQSPQDTRAPTSTSTATAKSSSWGKKRGALFGSGGKAKATSVGISHGPFAFEPAVSSPTRSTGSVDERTGHSAQLTVSWAGEKGRENSRVKEELEREKERARGREKEKRSQSAHRGDRAPVPVPGTSLGHRSGTKGRSLDLNLGLSWAPTTMRENTMMPSSGYFGRSGSVSSSHGGRSVGTTGGRSASGSTNGHATIEEERTILGNEVADVFKNALDATGYLAFRQCTPLTLCIFFLGCSMSVYLILDSYVHRFDAHEIPFDGPRGIVSRVERLLKTAPDLGEEGKRQLLDSFVRVVLQHA